MSNKGETLKYNDMDTDGNVEVHIDTDNGDAINDNKDEDDNDNDGDEAQSFINKNFFKDIFCSLGMFYESI